MGQSTVKEIAQLAAIKHFNDPGILKDLCTSEFKAHLLWDFHSEGLQNTINFLLEHQAPAKTRVIIDDCFAEGHKVAVRFRAFFPTNTGGEVVRDEIAILHFSGNKISEWWGAFDRQYEKDQGATWF